MHILSEAFLDCFPGRIINLHPALPGECPGTDAIRRTFETRKRGQSIRAGCMVHFVTSEPDAGPVIGQREVPLEWEDSLGLFEERMHAAERELVYEVLAKFALDNGRVEP
jgi:folate-dependent phosphoribosylglycinamide formyltransferase PurN